MRGRSACQGLLLITRPDALGCPRALAAERDDDGRKRHTDGRHGESVAQWAAAHIIVRTSSPGLATLNEPVNVSAIRAPKMTSVTRSIGSRTFSALSSDCLAMLLPCQRTVVIPARAYGSPSPPWQVRMESMWSVA